MLHRFFLAAIIVLSVLGLPETSTAQSVQREQDGSLAVDPASPLMSRLRVDAVTVRARPYDIDAPGEIVAEPARSIALLPPLTGRIARLDVVPGAHVRAGQVLAVIISGDMAQASADEDKARSAWVQAREQYDRSQHVVGVGGGAMKDLQAARAEYEQARSELDRASMRLAALGRDASAGGRAPQGAKMTLTAPIDGVIDTVSVAAGMNVTDITTVMMTLVDTHELWVVADLAENQASLVRAGMAARATVPVLPYLHLAGIINGLRPSMQPETRRRSAYFTLANPDGTLVPHLYAHVAIAVPQAPDITIPQTAILMNNDATTVFVEVRPHVFRRRVVDVVLDDGADSRVRSGLVAGDRVVTQGAVLLNDD
ncbi:efflux RND transporter periplasmic adaptor subunit [Acetobacter orleanensis]|uniref:efflux RND transporter periplasmic adaptor subunit n=1 Tax=Acetobacter orleanensis TaxID=104099 RepID=UPI000A46B597|nr:efflux RND transporter periplasmic adaptor subunit [Acetobacter orleanensis]